MIEATVHSELTADRIHRLACGWAACVTDDNAADAIALLLTVVSSL